MALGHTKVDIAGDAAYDMTLTIPATAGGKCLLKAVAKADEAESQEATVSRRWVSVAESAASSIE